MKHIESILIAALMTLTLSAQGGSYQNPVIRNNCPDPSVYDNRAKDGYFYAYSTQNGNKYIPIYRSKDLVNWTSVGAAFDENRPQWEEKSRMWAPDMNYINGIYVMYYALGVWGDPVHSASGVAVSPAPTGPFKDMGMIVSQPSTGVGNSIDPNYFEDEDGSKYLYWGSLGSTSGIFVVQLSDDGLSVKEGFKPVKLAGNDMEGTYVHKRKGYYYLFASTGSCCEGPKSTYRVIVGRSKSPLGPFVSKSGMSMITEGTGKKYDQVILKGDKALEFIGPGHDAEIVKDDAGHDWMLYHTFWKGNNYSGRCMALDRVFWDHDGWPYFKNGCPSTSAKAPRFKNR